MNIDLASVSWKFRILCPFVLLFKLLNQISPPRPPTLKPGGFLSAASLREYGSNKLLVALPDSNYF